MTAKKLRALGFPARPNMRIRLLVGVPVSFASCSKPIVALM
jgi:hypothetical protein